MVFSQDTRIQKVQSVALELLKEVDKVCSQEDITFFLRGGSVMGAVKYHGFVPWDDDTDIAVPRQDYQKFIDAFPRSWSNKYQLATYQRGDQIHAYFPRFLLTEAYRKELCLPKNNHLGFTILDVLPIDTVPSGVIQRNFFISKVYFYRFLGALHTASIHDTVSQHHGLKKLLINLFNKLNVQKLYSQEWTFEKLDRLYTSTQNRYDKYSGTITGSSLRKELFHSSVWGQGCTLQFEDSKFRVPEKYDLYLRQIYGENYLSEEPNIKKSHFIR